jgi:hypothetical protein
MKHIITPKEVGQRRQGSPLVLSNEVEVIPSNSDGAGHFCAVHGSGKNAATDGHISGEWALLVNVSA